VRELVAHGHRVLVQKSAGEGSGFSDAEYAGAGAQLVDTAADAWIGAEMVVKVKEPQPNEYPFLRPDLILFTYLHLAAAEELTHRMIESGVTGLAYETVTDVEGRLPLLEPMSEVAGRLSVQVGAQYLERPNHGRGVLIGGVPGVPPAEVTIIGGGIVGSNAAKVALGTGARVTVLDKSLPRLRELDDIFLGRITTIASNPSTLAEAAIRSDLVVGAVLIAGASAPKLLRRETVAAMKKGSVFVDVAIDQGGCSETSRLTSHTDPVYELEGVIHYCVPNIPALVPHTSTLALTNATLPYLQQLADKGFERAIVESAALRRGVNTHNGEITCKAVASSQGREWTELPVA
jgi:alanine dehydrogenase